MTATVQVAVIGAGPSGLAAAYHLSRFGLSVTILDRQLAPGGLWSTANATSAVHDDITLITSIETSVLPESEWRTNSPYPSKVDTQRYISDFATSLSPGVQFLSGFDVCATERLLRGWKLKATDGRRIAAEYLVLAPGVFETPRPVEALPGAVNIHSSAFRPTLISPNDTVAVIGSGNSAVGCALSAAQRGASVRMYWRSVPWMMPRFIRGVPSDTVPYNRVNDGVPRGEQAQRELARDAQPEQSQLHERLGAEAIGLPYQTSTVLGHDALELARMQNVEILLTPPSTVRDCGVVVHATGYISRHSESLTGHLSKTLHTTGVFSRTDERLFAVGQLLTEGGGFSLQAENAKVVAQMIYSHCHGVEEWRQIHSELSRWQPDLLEGFSVDRHRFPVGFAFSLSYDAAIKYISGRLGMAHG